MASVTSFASARASVFLSSADARRGLVAPTRASASMTRMPQSVPAPSTPPAFARRLAAAAASVALLATDPSPAFAAFGQSTIELSNFSWEIIECPKGKTTMTIGKAACVSVTADSKNPSKDTSYNADVFGRVFDTTGDNALDRDEASDAGRIANVAEVPPGDGRVTFEITVAKQSADAGLVFKGFKARSYPGGAFRGTPRSWASRRRDATFTPLWSVPSGTSPSIDEVTSRSLTRCYQIYRRTVADPARGARGRAPVFSPPESGRRGRGWEPAIRAHAPRPSGFEHITLASRVVSFPLVHVSRFPPRAGRLARSVRSPSAGSPSGRARNRRAPRPSLPLLLLRACASFATAGHPLDGRSFPP